MPIQRLHKLDRDEIHRQVKASVKTSTLIGQCLEFAWHGLRIIREWPNSPRVILQAGTASWPRVGPEQDDGVCATHFTYQWDRDTLETRLFMVGAATVARFEAGEPVLRLPEMHVWLALPDTNEIIDFTTGLWPEACLAATGLDWPNTRPPDYLWALAKHIPDGVYYQPDTLSTALALEILRKQGKI